MRRIPLTDEVAGAPVSLKCGEAEAARLAQAGEAAIADLRRQAVRLDGTLDAARRTVAKLEAEIRWARRSGGMRQLHPAGIVRAARRWANRHACKIRRSGLFDIGWYLYANPELEAAGADPIEHYVQKGWREGLSPNPLFSLAWYSDHYPDVRASGIEPLYHYIVYGAAEGRDPHPLFKGDWYLAQNPDVAAAGVNPLFHYISVGAAEDRNPHPLFNASWYVAQNPDVAKAGLNPLAHYISHGALEGRDPHPWFKGDWYLEQNPDVAAAGLNPLVHYITHGAAEGRDPHPDFKGDWYLAQNQDVIRAGQNPLVHFLDHGAAEGRESRPGALRSAALDRLLRMFHDDSTKLVIAACLDILRAHADRSITAEDIESRSDVAALVEQATQLARRPAGRRELDATVIVPVRDNVIHTLCCIVSLLSQRTSAGFEIVVVDDASSDATQAVFERIGGIVRYSRNAERAGFDGSCRAAAAKARGRILVFLHNDTIVLPNWLDELIGTLNSDPSIGLASSKLVNLDGSLQWAGGIAANNVSAKSFGRAADACSPQCNYLKNADRTSGASMAISKALWDRLGEGGNAGSPLLGEGADLAALVRGAGLRAVYQPFSAAIHHRGLGAAGFAATERELSPKSAPITEPRPQILFVEHCVPRPDRDAGSRTTMQYIEMFARAGFQITFWPQDLQFERTYVTAMQRLGIEVIYSWGEAWPAFEDWLQANKRSLDYAYLLRPSVAMHFIDPLREESKAKILFAGVDVHFKRLKMEFEQTGNAQARRDMQHMEKLEKDLWRKSDAVYYLSDSEIDLVKSVYPNKIAEVIPTFIYDPARLHETAERIRRDGIPNSHLLLFVGGFRHSPNVDSMVWFVGEIWPRIVAAVPDARLVIAGSFPPPEIERLASSAIRVSGAISDEELARLYGEANVAVVPLRFGAGVKGKLLEAMSYGTPVVTTSVGVQGIPEVAKCVDTGDDGEQFARAVIDVLRAPQSRVDSVIDGLNYLENTLTEPAVLKILSNQIPELRAYLDRSLRDKNTF